MKSVQNMRSVTAGTSALVKHHQYLENDWLRSFCGDVMLGAREAHGVTTWACCSGKGRLARCLNQTPVHWQERLAKRQLPKSGHVGCSGSALFFSYTFMFLL
jgi:hypothetical protein